MALPQPGIFALGTRNHYYLELDLLPARGPEALVRALADLDEPRLTTAGANLVVGLAPSVWSTVAPDSAPDGAVDMAELRGPDGFVMPATQHSAWVWISASSYDIVLDMVRASMAALSPVATLGDHAMGFAYRDSRDLTGFIDGTENPPLDQAPAVALVPEAEPGAGSSIVLTQRWVHDLGAFHGLDLADQEAVFGRTKLDSTELAEDVMPADSHVSRVVIEDEGGEELKVLRRSTSFGDATVQGLNFVSFASRPSVHRMMLERMAGIGGPRDRLTLYSRAVTGAYYVVPSLAALGLFKEGR